MAEQLLETKFAEKRIANEDFIKITGLTPFRKYFLKITKDGNTSLFVKGATVDKPTTGYFGPMSREEIVDKIAKYTDKYDKGTLIVSRAPSIIRQLTGAL